MKVIAAGETYLGVPYRYGGLDRKGLDCSGFIHVSFRDALSVTIPRNTAALYAWAEKIPAESLEPGDLLFFKTTNTGAVSHAGIYTGGGRFIHAASEGPDTGVIRSAMDEKYWKRTYAGAGRALPAGTGLYPSAVIAEAGLRDDAPHSPAAGAPGTPVPAASTVRPGAPPGAGAAPAAAPEEKPYRIGLALAPSWNGYFEEGSVVRGAAAQIRFGAVTSLRNRPLLVGLEFRPEWDTGLGVFRLPVTLSLGFDDKFRIFIGPAFSFGDAALKTGKGNRRYTGGTSWIGAIGLSAAPFSWEAGPGDLSVYGELAWQSYIRESGQGKDWMADFGAALRFSTGLRYTFKL
ncbi:MAG: C40 family peptidase [Treponema sp.]|nr:C40 family peptidase [Treponema sp.]